jgi:hypothetical protein
MNGDTKTARAFAEKKAKGRCTIKSYDIQGDTVKYALVCGDRTIDSSTTFHGDTSEGTEAINPTHGTSFGTKSIYHTNEGVPPSCAAKPA